MSIILSLKDVPVNFKLPLILCNLNFILNKIDYFCHLEICYEHFMPILLRFIISNVITWYQAELGPMMHFVITVHNVLRLILLSILVILTFLGFLLLLKV